MPAIKQSMARLRHSIEVHHGARKESRKAPRFAPAGQSTQVIVGADTSCDIDILRMSGNLYASYQLKRVYYSAFSPIPDASSLLQPMAPPLVREHRLYQADWLYRYYGFTIEELAAATPHGMLDARLDPKTTWALANRGIFPIDVNTAAREILLRVPGLGVKAVDRIIATRRHRTLRLDDLGRLTSSVKKLLPWITTLDWTPGRLLDNENLKSALAPPAHQLDLFAA
ncbi:MAG: biotin synthase [Proteobacteria bacterium]|nr:biotin synthase [Pseudomonadota bacterium]